MTHGRTRLVTALSGLALAAVIGVVPSTTAQAEPDIADVQEQVDALFHEAEEASERVQDAKLQLAELQGDLRTLRADQARQDETLDAAREQVQDSILSQYQGQGLSAVGEVVVSDNPTQFLAGMSTMSAYNRLQSHRFDTYATEVKALDIRSDATADRTAEVDATKAGLVKDQAAIDARLEKAESLLAELESEEREALLMRGSTAVPSTVEASGRAAAAVAYAMAQVGDSYVFGAAGPDAFDCSGLTMMAWGASGVGLSHSSSAQYASGTKVAAGDLRPGDLVFYYSPISHVGMYIGNGLIVNALNPGADVAVSPLYSMPYVGAVRPG
ncbi:MAG: NlpC/P60 family protein [Nocardioides sp.]|nr:NlpC/P60 family protein [Nocardioides sp.]